MRMNICIVVFLTLLSTWRSLACGGRLACKDEDSIRRAGECYRCAVSASPSKKLGLFALRFLHAHCGCVVPKTCCVESRYS